MGIWDQALGLERGQHRSPEPLSQRPDLVSGLPCALPDDQHRPPAGLDQFAGPGKLLRTGLGAPSGYPALRHRGRGAAGLGLHLVG